MVYSPTCTLGLPVVSGVDIPQHLHRSGPVIRRSDGRMDLSIASDANLATLRTIVATLIQRTT